MLVHGYDAWQEDLLSRLNGSFALAIFDEEKEVLLIARDRFGQKPLYWTTQGEYWLFSTEIKGLLTTGVVPQTPSTVALASYLYFGFIPQDLSAIKGVNKILPGHYLKVDLYRQTMIGQYWSFSEQFAIKKSLSHEEVYHQFGKIMEEAVQVSLPQEGNIGCDLTGDLGSSALCWFLNQLSTPSEIGAYTTFFEDPHPLKLEKSKEIANKLSLTHKFKQIEPDDVLKDLPTIVWHLDEPVADPSILQAWYLGQLAMKECHLVYTALGWEQMLAGSPRYFLTSNVRPPIAYFLAKLPSPLRDYIILPLLDLFRSKYKYRIVRNIDINREQVAYLMESALFKGKNRKKVSPYLYRAFDPEVFTQRFHRLTTLPGNINPSLYYDAKTLLPDCLLLQYERLLQANSLKVIAPYLDYRLAQFLAKIPEEIKFESGIPACLLKNLMKRLFHISPPFIEKSESFLDSWRNSSEIKHAFTALIKGRLVEEGLISGKWIRGQLNTPTLSEASFRQLWAILVMEVWFRLYINRPIDPSISKLSLSELLQM